MYYISMVPIIPLLSIYTKWLRMQLHTNNLHEIPIVILVIKTEPWKQSNTGNNPVSLYRWTDFKGNTIQQQWEKKIILFSNNEKKTGKDIQLCEWI